MPRRSRLVFPGIPMHVIQRGNNREACFYTDGDRQRYLDWLRRYAAQAACDIHAYVLMTTHVHLLLTPGDADSAGRLMKGLGQQYVQYFNRTYHRSGTLWEGRFRSSVIQDERYLLDCYRYVELNPVRAGITATPGEHRWSSYHANALGEADPVLTPHRRYLRLAEGTERRCVAYRALLDREPDPARIDAIRRATNGNFVIGDAAFMRRVEMALGRRVTPGRSGRSRRVGHVENRFARKG